MDSIDAVVEFNENGSLVWADGYAGAYARGATKEEALRKLPADVSRWAHWANGASLPRVEQIIVRVVTEKKSTLNVEDADSDLLFASERLPMDMAEYIAKKELCLRSARDLMAQYRSIPQKERGLVKQRRTFYGKMPTSAKEMLTHIGSAIGYYAEGMGIDFPCSDNLVADRIALFRILDANPALLRCIVHTAPDGELWTLKKLLRRIIWHDRLHARAMYRKAITFWPRDRIENPFHFTD